MQKPWVSDFTEILKTHGIWHVVLSFDSPHNSVCKTFLENKEEDARWKRTDEYSKHKHTVINAVATGEVCNQHRHGLGGIIHHNNLWP